MSVKFHWAARILGIMAILFISLFALDSFSPGVPLWQQIAGFMIHMIPSFILFIILLIAWKYELTGGIIFLLIGLIFIPFIFNHNFRMNHSVSMSVVAVIIVNFPFILIGSLFILSHFMKKKHLTHLQH